MRGHRRLAILATHPIHYQVQLARSLTQVPHLDVTVLFCSRFGLDQQMDHTFGRSVRWYDESILEGYRSKFLTNYSWQRSPASFFGTLCPGVFGEIARSRYDALLIQGYADVAAWCALAAGKHSSCRLLFRGETAFAPRRRWPGAILQREIMRALSKSVEVFLPIGSRSREFYLRHGISNERMILCPYTVDNEQLFSKAQELHPQRDRIRTSLGLLEELPVILCVAKMTPRKRPLDLLRAFEKLRRPAYVVWVGDGPERPKIESTLSRKSLDRVRCVGFQNQQELLQFYAIADLFVLPSEYEPWGLVVNEAMCFSLPVVTTHGVSSSADLVVHGENGFLYEAGEIEALSQSLEALLSQPSLRSTMGQRSRQIIQGWDQRASVEGICRAITLERVP